MDNIFFTRIAREDDSTSEIEVAIKFHSVTSHSIALPVDQLRFPALRRLLHNHPKLISDGVIKFVIGSVKARIVEYLGERTSGMDLSRFDAQGCSADKSTDDDRLPEPRCKPSEYSVSDCP